MPKTIKSTSRSLVRTIKDWINLNAAIVFSIVVVGIMGFSQTTSLRVLNPVPILQLLVVISVFSSNFLRAATVTLIISLAYSVVYYSDPNQLFYYTPDNIKRMIVVFVSLPLTIFLVAVLNRRNKELLSEGIKKEREVDHQKQVVAILESISDAFFALDKQLRFTYINRQADNFFYGREKDELLRQSITDLFPAFKTTLTYRKIQQAMKSSRSAHFEDYIAERDRYYQFNVYPSRAGVSIYFKDITEQKKGAENMMRLGQAVQHAEDAIFSSTADGTIISWNEGAAKIYGYTEKEMVGRHSLVLYPDNNKKEFDFLQSKIMKGKTVKRYETVRVRKDGKSIYISLTKTPVKDSKGKIIAVAAVARDITHRKKMEAELRQSRDQLQIIFKNVADGITVQDTNGKVIYINDAAAKLIGFDSPEEVIQIVEKKGVEAFRKISLARFDMRNEQGAPLSFTDMPAYIALNSGVSAEKILQYRDKKTNKSFWSIVKSSPILDENKKVQYAVNVVSDITEHKELERRKDEFLSIASHELKTPLTSIKGFAYLLKKTLQNSKNDKALTYVSRINQYTDKITNLIGDLLDVSKIQAGKLIFHNEEFEFDLMLREVVGDIKASYDTHDVKLLGKTDIRYVGDRNRLEQVISNLLSNAIKYSPNAQNVELRATKKNGSLIVSVRDYGVGIPKSKADKVFERFYRVDETSAQFSGLGIGLYISREIIKRHGGRIWAESELGKGSTFYFSLPLKDKQKQGVNQQAK